MKKAAAKQTTTRGKSGEKPELTGSFIALQFLDTGWRVALPILALSYGGIRLDKHLSTKPLYSLIGFFSGLFVSGFLIYKQIKSTFPEFVGGEKNDK